jgi:hypothetical protein
MKIPITVGSIAKVDNLRVARLVPPVILQLISNDVWYRFNVRHLILKYWLLLLGSYISMKTMPDSKVNYLKLRQV